jgi:hypothetical protein
VLVTVWAFIAAALSPRQSLLSLFGIAVIWSISAYLGFTWGRFVPGVALVTFVMPTITVLAVIGKHRGLSHQYHFFKDSLGQKKD